MSAQLTCDGCGKKKEDGEDFKRVGYLDEKDYCPGCYPKWESHDQSRRNAAFRAGEKYRREAKGHWNAFAKENPDFKLPDGDTD